jgi:uncharacterized membrane protein YdbT with pleckstrin-like domain
MIVPFLAALVIAGGGVALLALSSSPGGGLAFRGTASAESQPFPLVWIAAGLFLVAVVVMLIARWRRSATEMVVTNKRVLVKVGTFAHRSTEIMLSKVESVVVDQGIPGRVLGYGTIVVRGTGGTTEPFAKIAHPLELRRQVQQQIDQLSQSKLQNEV